MTSVTVRWHLRYGLPNRDVKELPGERGMRLITSPHTRFSGSPWSSPRPCRHTPGDRRLVDDTYAKTADQRAYPYRAVNQHGQVTGVLLSLRRDLSRPGTSSHGAARRHGPGRGQDRPHARLPASARRDGRLGSPHR